MKKKTLLLAGLCTLTLCSCGGSQPVTFTVMFDGNGGTLVSGNEIQKVSKASEIVAPTYTRDGYTFNGWDKDITTITTDTLVKAQWIVTPTPVETFTVTFDSNGGSLVPAQTIEKGKLASRPTNPTRENYSFVNWYKENTFANVFDFSTPIISNITLYAKWVEEKVGECTYKLNEDQKSYCVSGVLDKTCTTYNILSRYNNLPITSIGDRSFEDCTSLTSIIIPSSVTSIGGSAFSNCTSLISIIIPNSVTSIGGYTFENCTSLTSITIPDSVTSIGNYAFRNCTSLQSIKLGSGVTSIRYDTFLDCVSLKSITIPNNISYIEDSAFSNCTSLESIILGSGVRSISENAFYNCPSLSSIVVDSNNREFDSRNNCNAIIRTDYNSLVFGCKNSIIPNSVVSIGSYAFYNCTSLTSITIPTSVTNIYYYAFNNCTSLESIIYAGTKSQWKSITKGEYWHKNCPTKVVRCTDGYELLD